MKTLDIRSIRMEQDISNRSKKLLKKIKLTMGYEALVDDEDFESLSRFTWHVLRTNKTKVCYAVRSIHTKNGTRKIRMHRVIMGCDDHRQVDHIDHDGLNNQKLNLRVCTKLENYRNRRHQKNASNKYIGVFPYKSIWKARIWHENKIIYLGSFKTEKEAALERDRIALKLRGSFAELNFPVV